MYLLTGSFLDKCGQSFPLSIKLFPYDNFVLFSGAEKISSLTSYLPKSTQRLSPSCCSVNL